MDFKIWKLKTEFLSTLIILNEKVIKYKIANTFEYNFC